MAKPGDTAAFEPLSTVSFQGTAPFQEAASPEDIRALEEYLVHSQQAEPKTQAEPKKKKSPLGEMLMLAFGVVLCAVFSISEFGEGNIVMGLILAFAAVFAALMVYSGLTYKEPANPATPRASNAIEQLRASGELDAAARDFPREAQQANDGLRLGKHYLFRKQGTVHSYAEITHVWVEKKAMNGITITSLEVRYVSGLTESLYIPTLEPSGAGNDRMVHICQAIQSANPFVQIG